MIVRFYLSDYGTLCFADSSWGKLEAIARWGANEFGVLLALRWRKIVMGIIWGTLNKHLTDAWCCWNGLTLSLSLCCSTSRLRMWYSSPTCPQSSVGLKLKNGLSNPVAKYAFHFIFLFFCMYDNFIQGGFPFV